jgi:hypothetical protein
LFHAALVLTQNSIRLSLFDYAMFDWVTTIIGIVIMNIYMVTLLEFLKLFNPIAPFWSSERVSRLQKCTVPVHILLNLGMYVRPLRTIPSIAPVLFLVQRIN